MTMDATDKWKWKTDWAKCCLCQQDKKEALTSPITNPTKRGEDGYSNISSNVPLFYAINDLPIVLDPARLDEGQGIETTLRKNNAKYHQSCRLLFSNSKLQRAQKRSFTSASLSHGEENVGRKRRRTLDLKASVCFLCEKQDQESSLRKAMTMELNDRLN